MASHSFKKEILLCPLHVKVHDILSSRYIADPLLAAASIGINQKLSITGIDVVCMPAISIMNIKTPACG